MELKFLYVFIIMCCCYCNTLGQNWIYGYSTGTIGQESGRVVAFDNLGNYYLLGQVESDPNNYNTDIDFGNGVSFTIDDSGKHGFVVKYNSNNEAQWVTRFLTNGNDGVKDMVVDAFGNIFVIGQYQFLAKFGNVTLAGVTFNTYLAKFSSAGVFQWVIHTTTTTNSGRVVCKDLETDGSNVYLTGYFQGTQTFGPHTITSQGGDDIFLAKVSNFGSVLFFIREGGGSNAWGKELAFDGSYIILTGWFRDIATIAGQNLFSYGGTDMFLAKYNSLNFSPSWGISGGSIIYNDEGSGVIVDQSTGDIYLVGIFGNEMNIGSTMNNGGMMITSAANTDFYIAKYNTLGSLDWAKNSSGLGYAGTGNLVLNGSGSLVIYGSSSGELTFESQSLNSSDWQKFLGEFDSNGNLISLEQLEETGQIEGTSDKISTDGNSTIYKTGSFSGTINFGSIMLTSTGNRDLYITKREGGILPVELLNFTAYPISNEKFACMLEWQTVSEVNTDYFELQHSVDGISFSRIGIVNAVGNSSNLQEYAFKHLQPSQGENYYRLHIHDFDGTSSTSSITVVVFEDIHTASIFPNPTQAMATLKITGDVEVEDLLITNAIGQNFTTSIIQVADNTWHIDTNSLIHGVYQVSFKIDGRYESIRLVIQ